MNNEELFRRWHAAAGPWGQWVKPSLLAQAPDTAAELSTSDIDWLPPETDTALVIDLPGVESVTLGAALAKRGYCVVALFNTVPGPSELVDTHSLSAALRAAAPDLTPRLDGPPAFLLDATRQTSRWNPPRAGDFDNRWFVFQSDFPSQAKLAESGIKRLIVVRHDPLAPDLHDALSGHGSLQPTLIDPSSKQSEPFPEERSPILRGLSAFGRVLHKNPDGTFGHRISQG